MACCSHCAVAASPQTDLVAQPSPNIQISTKAKELGFDVKKLDSIDRKISDLVKQRKVLGCSALIFRNGEEIYFGKWGNQNQRKQIPIQRDTIFRIYSMTKPITSVAAMQLVEQGKLDINAPVSDYLPEFDNLKVLQSRNGESREVALKRTMKVLDLLRHTSGLSYGFFGNTLVDREYLKSGILLTDANLESMVGKLGKIPLLHHPGTQFHYSASTDVLGRVIEVVSEKSFDQYLRESLFEPLGMKDTFFNVPLAKQDRMSQLYKPNLKGELVVANPLHSIRFLTPGNEFFSGGGGLCSTVDDYLSFCKMLLNKGELNGKRFLAPETVEKMFSNQLGKIERSNRSFKFGLGFRVFPQGDFGWGGMAGTRFWVHPKNQTAVIYMMQISPSGGRKYGEIVRKATFEALR